MTNNTQLPAEVLEEIKRKANQFVKHTCYQHEMSIGRFSFEAGATEYATKLHQCDKSNSALEEANRGLVEQNKEWKAKCERLAKLAEHWQQEYFNLNPPRQPLNIDNNPIS